MENINLCTRRKFIKQSSLVTASLALGIERKPEYEVAIEVLNPRNQVPLSFIIDDSTPLVNMAYFGIPQFHQVFPERYPQDWRKLPREIPDDFVREFGDYCKQHKIKGKYSVVPYPACTGWVDRFIPGWSHQELKESIKLIRDFMQPDWDIHPEMISHTRVIDIKTGRPYPEASPDYMENWDWSQNKSADELGEYLAYALKVLKNSDLFCEGVTTPGGFCSQNKENLALATQAAVDEVYGVKLSHYFRDLYTDPDQSVAPQVKYPNTIQGANPSCVVSIIGCTGDWFGGWDGLTVGSVDKFISQDLTSGRMVEVIEKGEPAIMVCHWPGIYFNGEKTGFHIFQEVVDRLEKRYGQLNWMKNSDIARYWAAKELTTFSFHDNKLSINAPFATSDFTIKLPVRDKPEPVMHEPGHTKSFRPSKRLIDLKAYTYFKQGQELILCFPLKAGRLEIHL
ncbi:MAG: hypothetical protein ACNS62_03105 [Candidatus Cyclobacteriaceae bacterium M3_2C_046]